MPHAHFHKHLAEEIQMLHAHFHEYLACENRGTAKPAGKGAFYGGKRGRNARVSELNLQASDAQCHAPRFLRARRRHGSIRAGRGGGVTAASAPSVEADATAFSLLEGRTWGRSCYWREKSRSEILSSSPTQSRKPICP